MNSDQKHRRYQRAYKQLADITKKVNDPISQMATISAVLYHKMTTFYWIGFYRLIGSNLLIGPYQGTVACSILPENRGVCWEAIQKKQVVVVPDVNKFVGHIACDPRSKSEIVVPCYDKAKKIFAVLDVDSDKLNTFDKIDVEHLSRIVKLIDK